MKRNLLASLAGFLVALQAMAQTGATIDVPETAPAYTMVEVVSPTPGTGHVWFILGPRGFEKFYPVGTAENHIVFTGPPGEYKIMLAAIQQDGGHLDTTTTVTIGKPIPPGPDPPNPPEPPNPIWKDWAEWTHKTTTEKLASPTLQAEAATLAKRMKTVLQASKGGDFTDPKVAREAMRQATREALGPGVWPRWETNYGQPLAAALESWVAEGKLTTFDDYHNLWAALISGLERAAQ